jgi:ATP-binding cassette subfamily F protein 3
VLILDEPTNHLDLESREALEQALDQFGGSLLLVSHDRALLDALGKRTVAIEDGTLHSYLGGWPEYVRVREERARRENVKPEKAAKPRAKSASTAPPSNNAKEQQRLEREIEAAEASLKALEEELSDPVAWSTPQRSATATARHEQAKAAVDQLYARWESLAG